MREASRRVAQRIQASDVGTGSEGGVESTGVGDHRAGLHGSDLITCGDFFVLPSPRRGQAGRCRTGCRARLRVREFPVQYLGDESFDGHRIESDFRREDDAGV